MISGLLAVAVILVAMPAVAGHIEAVDVNGAAVQAYVPDIPAPQMSEDGKTLQSYNPVIMLVDPNPPEGPRHIPPPTQLLERAADAPAGASFGITYLPDGEKDPFGATCTTFPEEAKEAFNAAANIWGGLLYSKVPITISACWADLGNTGTLGYSGGAPRHRDFEHAPRPHTWYGGALANALAGTDLKPNSADMHITYNLNSEKFAWYFGTDGNTPPEQIDFLSVVLHEIGHGLNFSGSMVSDGVRGDWGFETPYPDVYDTFIYDRRDRRLVNTKYFLHGSQKLGTALTSEALFFRGAYAMSANGAQGVKIYAPPRWQPGSSYAHLDYKTFANTPNALMVYAIGNGVSRHDPGPVSMGILKDLGWLTADPGDSANLAPYTPPDWSGPIVVSTRTGTSIDDETIRSDDFVYVSWAAINNGSANINRGFDTTLAVDGVDVHTWPTNSLAVDQYTYVEDYQLGQLAVGWHTITLRVDSTHVISERDEGDNVYERSIYVTPPTLPNLKPFRPLGWSNRLVVTHTEGGTVDSNLFTGPEVYVSFAVKNVGDADINKMFFIELYIDENLFTTRWFTKKLPKGQWVYVIGQSIGGLSPGTHHFRLLADSPDRITESNENDNHYIRDILVR